MRIKVVAIIFTVMLILLSVGIAINHFESRKNSLLIATTTSLDNTGVLDSLITAFKEESGIEVGVIPRGSGVAVDLGRKGEVDAIFVHAPDLEQELVNDGIAINHTTLWYNYFIIVGPKDDPANINEAHDVFDAMSRICSAGNSDLTSFYSRGDNSGTHIKELSLWTDQPDCEKYDWYFETGTGMSATLTIANENDGYVLTDLGTYTQLHSTGVLAHLVKLFVQDDALYNPYSYMIISPDIYPDLNTEYAFKFLSFLQSRTAKNIVNDLVIGDIQLFTPVEE